MKKKTVKVRSDDTKRLSSEAVTALRGLLKQFKGANSVEGLLELPAVEFDLQLCRLESAVKLMRRYLK